MTPEMQTKMLSYMCILSLMVENYLLDASALATDLSMPASKSVSHLARLMVPSTIWAVLIERLIFPEQGHRHPPGSRLRGGRPVGSGARGSRSHGNGSAGSQKGRAQGAAHLQGGQQGSDQEVGGFSDHGFFYTPQMRSSEIFRHRRQKKAKQDVLSHPSKDEETRKSAPSTIFCAGRFFFFLLFPSRSLPVSR